VAGPAAPWAVSRPGWTGASQTRAGRRGPLLHDPSLCRRSTAARRPPPCRPPPCRPARRQRSLARSLVVVCHDSRRHRLVAEISYHGQVKKQSWESGHGGVVSSVGRDPACPSVRSGDGSVFHVGRKVRRSSAVAIPARPGRRPETWGGGRRRPDAGGRQQVHFADPLGTAGSSLPIDRNTSLLRVGEPNK
jgi:hypothetical protein